MRGKGSCVKPLRQIRRLAHDPEAAVSEDVLQMCIDQMNEITNAI